MAVRSPGRGRYLIVCLNGRHERTRRVLVEAGDIAEAIGPWYADHTCTELQWMAVVDMQEAAQRHAPLRVYAHLLEVSITEINDEPPGAATVLAEEPTRDGAHVRDREGHIWIRQHVGWLSARGRQRLTWGELEERFGRLRSDEETRLLEQLGGLRGPSTRSATTLAGGSLSQVPGRGPGT